MIDAVVDDPPGLLRDIRISKHTRIAIILAVDYDSTLPILSHLPSGRDLDGHGSRISAESKARGEVWCSNKNCESIVTGFEVDGLDAGSFWIVWRITMGLYHIGG